MTQFLKSGDLSPMEATASVAIRSTAVRKRILKKSQIRSRVLRCSWDSAVIVSRDSV